MFSIRSFYRPQLLSDGGIGAWLDPSQIDLNKFGILFLGYFLMIYILDYMIYGGSVDSTSIVLTETSITGRSIGLNVIETLTFQFDDISKMVTHKHRWHNPNKVVAKTKKEFLFIQPLATRIINRSFPS